MPRKFLWLIDSCCSRQEESEAESAPEDEGESQVKEDRPVHLCPAPVQGFDEAVKDMWANPPPAVPAAGLVG